MKTFFKFALLSCVAVAATALLLGLALRGVHGITLGAALPRLALNPGLYAFLALLVLDCFCFANDLLAFLSLQRPGRFGVAFSEIAFRHEGDDTPIPLRLKLSLLYPLTMAIALLALVVGLGR